MRGDVPMVFEPPPLLFGRELEGGRGERDGPGQRAPAEPLRLRRLAHEDVRVRERTEDPEAPRPTRPRQR